MTNTEIIDGVEYWISPTTGEYIPYSAEELARKKQYARITDLVANEMATSYGYKIRR